MRCSHLENILISDDGNKSIKFSNRFESNEQRNEVKIIKIWADDRYVKRYLIESNNIWHHFFFIVFTSSRFWFFERERAKKKKMPEETIVFAQNVNLIKVCCFFFSLIRLCSLGEKKWVSASWFSEMKRYLWIYNVISQAQRLQCKTIVFEILIFFRCNRQQRKYLYMNNEQISLAQWQRRDMCLSAVDRRRMKPVLERKLWFSSKFKNKKKRKKDLISSHKQ